MKTLLRITAALAAVAAVVCFGLFIVKGAGSGKLAWEDPIVRKSIMTFAYKIYGDPAAQNGRYFLSKIVFRNDGNGPVRNLSVSYQIPDYVGWTTPETYPEVSPGQTVVELYYPQLPAKVTQLTSQTNATLETKIHWSDEAGKEKEQVLRSNIILRSVNEIEYTDLPSGELLTWYDMFATAPFATAMVTPNDPVVKEFISEVTKRTGGTTAGIVGGPKEVLRIMQAVYDYMCSTGMRYTSDSGVPERIGDVQTTVQTVRLPRDVILTNEGLCIELAILWASIMEHLGLPSTVVFIPGHALTVVQYGQGSDDIIPIECTAITPMAVGAK
jgi:transglutaminase-like putative cysteine protease